MNRLPFLLLVCPLLISGVAKADLITVQPIRVTMSDGTGGPSINLFTAETQKIYAQAGHTVSFLGISTFMSDTYVNLASSDFSALVTGIGHQQHANANVLNMYFVNTIASMSGGTTYGIGFLGGNGIAIASDSVNAFNGGIGRLDTIAHEIGHNLGLGHNDFGAGSADNVMTSGGSRTVPTSLAQITPDGLGLSKFTRAQQGEMALSSFTVAVPEPGGFALLAFGSIGFYRRRAVSSTSVSRI